MTSLQHSATPTFPVVVEIPRGERNKYEVDHETGRIKLDRTLFTSMGYPADYGFIEGTLGLDGDPLDALVLTEFPVFPGCTVESRAVGMLVMTDEHGPDAKIICVPDDVRCAEIHDITDLSDYKLAEIKHFFEQYKVIEPGKHVDAGLTWAPLDAAEEEIAASFERAKA